LFIQEKDRGLSKGGKHPDSALKKIMLNKQNIRELWDEQESKLLASGFNIGGFAFTIDLSTNSVVSTSVHFLRNDRPTIGTYTVVLKNRKLITEFSLGRTSDFVKRNQVLSVFLRDWKNVVKLSDEGRETLLNRWQGRSEMTFSFTLAPDSKTGEYILQDPDLRSIQSRIPRSELQFGKYVVPLFWADANGLHLRDDAGFVHTLPAGWGRKLGEIDGREAFPKREVDLYSFFGSSIAEGLRSNSESLGSLGYALVHPAGNRLLPDQEFYVVDDGGRVITSLVIDNSGVGYAVTKEGYYIYTRGRMHHLQVYNQEYSDVGGGVVNWVIPGTYAKLMRELEGNDQKQAIQQRLEGELKFMGIIFMTSKIR